MGIITFNEDYYRRKLEEYENKPRGIAIGRPMRGKEILEYVYKYNIRFIHAPEDKILDARKALALKGVYCEHTTAANYAAYLAYCEKYGPTSDCLITMCGAGLKSDH